MDESDLIKNLKEYLRNSQSSYERSEYNTAITLFFKALVTISDWYILKQLGTTPSSHETRFRILQSKFPFLYRILDRDFPFYIESYRTVVRKDAVDLVKNDVKYLIKRFKLDEKINQGL